MRPAAFEYHRPGSLEEAIALLAGDGEARPLAGGHSLLPMMKLRLATPTALVDLGRIAGLAGIEREDGGLRIGALTTHDAVARSELVQAECPALAEAAAVIGDAQVRNRGTIGGSAAHADPGADSPTVLKALGATIAVAGPGGEREIGADDFFRGLFETALRAGELVTAVRVPATPHGGGAAYVKHAHPASGYAVVGVAAAVTVAGGACTAARVTVGGAVPSPVHAEAAGAALEGEAPSAGAVASAAAAVAEALTDPLGDGYASGEYRRHLATVLARRALRTAFERAGSTV
jgi:aerobic carbon-monoxide dehydrogenase medium subunit